MSCIHQGHSCPAVQALAIKDLAVTIRTVERDQKAQAFDQQSLLHEAVRRILTKTQPKTYELKMVLGFPQPIHHLIPRPPLARLPAAPNGGFETGISWATEESSTSLLQTYV